MENKTEQAKRSIYTYAFGMDTSDWKLATTYFADEIAIDYRAVGMTSGTMKKSELQDFLKQLLGKPELRVHTAISQVLANPADDAEFIAYYTVRHYKGEIGKAENFSVFGWYSFALTDGLITSLKINVQAMEGNPAVLS